MRPWPQPSLNSVLCSSCVRLRWTGQPQTCPRCGRYNDLVNPTPFLAETVLGRFVEYLLRPPGRWTFWITWITAVWTISFQARGSLPDPNFANPWELWPLFFLWATLTIIWLTRFLGRFTALILNPVGEIRRPGWQAFINFPLIFSLVYASGYLAVPLRVSFLICRPALLNHSGPNGKLTPGFSAFPFEVIEYKKGGRMTVWTVHNGPEIGEVCGFARCPAGCTADDFPNDNEWYNEVPTEILPLDHEWCWWRQ